MQMRLVTNVSSHDIEVVLGKNLGFEHVCLKSRTSISVPEKCLTDICFELKRRMLITII